MVILKVLVLIEGTDILPDQTMQLGRGIENHFRVSLVDDGIGY